MELSSLAGAIALSMLVYKLFECTRVNAVLTTANRNYEIENGRLRTSINSSRGADDVVKGKAVSQTISALEASLEEKMKAEKVEWTVKYRKQRAPVCPSKMSRARRNDTHV